MTDHYLNALCKLFEDLDRQGPGSAASTRKAIGYIRKELSAHPKIADIGCGTGAQTLILAEELGGSIIAVDNYKPYLDQLAFQADQTRTPISCLKSSMSQLSLKKGAFDLIWSEGAVYLMGFKQGMCYWKSFLKPSGFIVVSEMSWFREHAPPEATSFWQTAYPAMQTVADNLATTDEAGLENVAHFSLPASDWWENFYYPLQAKIDLLSPAERADKGMQSVIADTLQEMEIMKKFSYFCGYEFYIMKKP